MIKINLASVDAYIAAQPKAVQGVLRTVRAAIRKAVPKAGEAISYGMPAYKLHGAAIAYFAAWKQHYSFYPASGHTVAALQKELAGYDVRKGTIRFPYSEPVPVRLITRIVKLRAKEAAAKARAEQSTGARRRSGRPTL